jgi:hypothetical protein
MRADRQLLSIVFLRLVAAAPRARAVAAPKSLSAFILGIFQNLLNLRTP